MTTAIVAGSVAAAARQKRVPLARAFMDVEHVVLVDVSPSMAEVDGRGGRTRISVAQEELATLQARHPGQLAIFTFSDECRMVPGGVPALRGAGTDLAGALRAVRKYDGLVTSYIIISDGEPNDEPAALAAAGTYTTPISTVYVGPESGEGRGFLARLARAAKGTSATADRAQDLAKAVEPMLLLTGGG